MKIGCFALVDAFRTLDHQLARIREMGFDCADITDNHPGGLLGGDVFDAAVSLDCNPFDVKRLFDEYDLTISSVAAHAHLLDPTHPARYGTSEIMKSLKLAATLKIECVITTEHAGSTAWARNLSYEQQIFTIAEKLYEPLRLAGTWESNCCLNRTAPSVTRSRGSRTSDSRWTTMRRSASA